MKRDLKLVKEILSFFEQRNNDKMIDFKHIIDGTDMVIQGYTGYQVLNHIIIMYEAGLIEGYGERTKDGRLISVYPTRLTWEGHEFISAANNHTAWVKLIKQIKTTGSALPFKVAQSLLQKYIETEVGL